MIEKGLAEMNPFTERTAKVYCRIEELGPIAGEEVYKYILDNATNVIRIDLIPARHDDECCEEIFDVFKVTSLRLVYLISRNTSKVYFFNFSDSKWIIISPVAKLCTKADKTGMCIVHSRQYLNMHTKPSYNMYADPLPKYFPSKICTTTKTITSKRKLLLI